MFDSRHRRTQTVIFHNTTYATQPTLHCPTKKIQFIIISYWHSVSQLPITTYLSQNSLMKTKLMAIIRTTLKSSICGYLASSVLRRSAQVTLAGNQNRSFKTYAAKPPAIVAHVSYTQCEWNDVFSLSVLILVQSRTESREFLTGGLYHHTQSTFKQSTRDILRLTSSLTP